MTLPSPESPSEDRRPVPGGGGGPNVRLRSMGPADHADVLALNQRHVELTAPLDEPRLVQMQAWADRACVIDVDGSFAGFVITFASGSAYDGENFGWFGQRYAEFCYLDRIVVHEDFRRRGLADFAYAEIESRCDRPVLTLEVNLDPPNEPSLAFHRSRAYAGVGERLAGDHVVLLMAKQLS